MTENSFKAILEVGKQLVKGAVKKGTAKATKEVVKKGTKDKLKKEGVKKAATSRKGKEKVVGTGVKPHKPLLGQNPRASKHRTSTDLGPKADRATAKSIFRNQTRGERVVDKKYPEMKMRTSEGGTKIRFNKKDGSTRVDLPNRGTKPNGETIHFKE